jgi:tetratricopeptide (TPR) repeat protein
MRQGLAVLALVLAMCVTSIVRGLEVTLVLNTPDKKEFKGTLESLSEDGTITLMGAYGVQTFNQGQYVSAVCPEPPEQSLAVQSYMKGEYPKALELYKTVQTKYRVLGWGSASLEGMGNCHRQMGKTDEAIEAYSSLVEQYPTYAGIRRASFALAQASESKGNVSRAVELYEKIAWEGDDELSALSLRNNARILYANGKYQEALLDYLRVAILYQSFPNAPVAEATFRAGDCFEKVAADESYEVANKLRERAKKYYADVITRFPQSEFAPNARLRYQQLTSGSPEGIPTSDGKPSAGEGK